ncbi:BLUF domain-containing protein [Sphingomonas sp. R86520]|uniref:BLUF domain-containing protein n=1 Tax=Sphingomonas sp. R86520 TaxID=3093859 RepID=UPI0036D3C128
MLRRLIYISRSMIGADPKQVEAIVSTSIRRNAPLELTGMLWADGESFAQVIEGDPHRLEQTMDRIRIDRRHLDIEVLLDRSVASRQFGNWSMRQAVDDEASAHASTFMIGFAMGERTNLANRLYEIVLESDRRNLF